MSTHSSDPSPNASGRIVAEPVAAPMRMVSGFSTTWFKAGALGPITTENTIFIRLIFCNLGGARVCETDGAERLLLGYFDQPSSNRRSSDLAVRAVVSILEDSGPSFNGGSHYISKFLFQLRSLAHESLVDRLCYNELDSNPEIDAFKKKIVAAILANDLYKSSNPGQLIPASSRFYANGRSTSDKPDFADVLRHLEVRARIKEFEYESHSLRLGLLRYRLPNVLPFQVSVFIEVQPGVMLFMTKSLPKLHHVTTDFLVNDLGCLISPVRLDDAFLKEILDSTIEELDSAAVGELELAFANIKTTNNALSQLVINVPRADVAKFPKTNFSAALFEHLRKNTAIDFQKLQLTKIRCDLYLFLAEGRLRFNSELGFQPYVDEEDPRPSLWPFLMRICDLCT
ncbi:hypothetical protein OGAPHI_006513 [Ogataea philodendri]|uniref:Uncharacterized protein n=1 Tax=Ogataea philodendri TaxID=1378263 RepID=A0A9P8NXE3_9ASCO|nr:uncharacterized protein OGAPHI_006513 [Ogataea philodendri]KAH3661663.1 hypothetical protein OGAPHI_006513 [Ogataea philodendri]